MEHERNLGDQPIIKIMTRLELTPHDLVEASTEQITHKMVKRACKGRWCTKNTRMKVRNALNALTEEEYRLSDLFTY